MNVGGWGLELGGEGEACAGMQGVAVDTGGAGDGNRGWWVGMAGDVGGGDRVAQTWGWKRCRVGIGGGSAWGCRWVRVGAGVGGGEGVGAYVFFVCQRDVRSVWEGTRTSCLVHGSMSGHSYPLGLSLIGEVHLFMSNLLESDICDSKRAIHLLSEHGGGIATGSLPVASWWAPCRQILMHIST